MACRSTYLRREAAVETKWLGSRPTRWARIAEKAGRSSPLEVLAKPILAGSKPEGRFSALLGVEESGRPLWINLHDPGSSHVVVFGAQGPAVSELLRTSLISLALRAAPAELQLAAVDGSGCELRVVEALPHAVAPLAELPHDAVELLEWLADESRRRLLRGYERPEIVLFLDGVREETSREPSFAAALEDVLRLGPLSGVHVFATSIRRPVGIPWAARSRVVEAFPARGEGWFHLLGDSGRGTLFRAAVLSARDLDESVRWIRGERGGHRPANEAVWALAGRTSSSSPFDVRRGRTWGAAKLGGDR
jgi:hypothetical protein